MQRNAESSNRLSNPQFNKVSIDRYGFSSKLIDLGSREASPTLRSSARERVPSKVETRHHTIETNLH